MRRRQDFIKPSWTPNQAPPPAGTAVTCEPVTITVPWKKGGGSLSHTQVLTVPGVAPDSHISLTFSGVPDVAENDAEELEYFLCSATYLSPTTVRAEFSFRNPVAGPLNFQLMVI